MPSWRSASSLAVAMPTIPPPMTTASHWRGASMRAVSRITDNDTSLWRRLTATPVQYPHAVALPLKPPVKPQLALSRKELPEGEEWIYEPKFDGFRVIAFVDGEEVYLQSRGAKPLRRYFPELEFPPGRYVLDGELLILGADGHEQFDALQNRLHPAESRVRMLAVETPALLRAFDLLAEGKKKLIGQPFVDRRHRLESLVAASEGARGPPPGRSS